MPLYYSRQTKFMPIHVSDLVEIIYYVIKDKKTNFTLECVGPEILLLGIINKTIKINK